MSFDKKSRKIRSVSGKAFQRSSGTVAIYDGYNFAAVIAQTLQGAFGGTRMSIKSVMAYTGAGERTVKNWFAGKNGPNGKNLVELVRHSDEVLETLLLMAGREDILAGKLLVDAHDKLVEMLELIDQLKVEGSGENPTNG